MKHALTVISLLALSGAAPLQAQAYSGGSGTAADPFRIATSADLRFLSGATADWAKSFRQTADILLDTANFLPIGSGTTLGWAFRGSYDGDGHAITGLRMRKPATGAGYDSAWGFFGTIQTGAEVKNLRLIDARVQGNSRTGGLAGQNNGTVSNCRFGGTVAGSTPGQRVGGLIGYNRGWITGSHTSGSVQGFYMVGGLVGFSEGVEVSHPYDTLVQKSSSSADVVGEGDVGGLIGSQFEYVAGRPSLAISFATGSVRGRYNVGGLVGNQALGWLTDVYATGWVICVTNCGGLTGLIARGRILRAYSTGPLKGDLSSPGGLVGTDSLQRAEDSFWDTASSGQAVSAGGAGKSTAEMKAQSLYLGADWSFDSTWTFSSRANQGYPIFQWQPLPAKPVVATWEAFQVMDTGFTARGRLTDLGKSAVSAYGFAWNTTGMPEKGRDSEKNLGSAGDFVTFTEKITGLVPDTRYFIRAFAVNDSGIAYGRELSVLTHSYKGAGTEADPYRLANKSDLRFLSEHPGEWGPDLNYLLTADIAFAAADFAAGGAFHNNGEGFRPIGRLDTAFQGGFDGGGHEISGLKINRNKSEQALFGATVNATLGNIGLVNIDIKGWGSLGGLVGRAYCRTGAAARGGISKVYVTGRIEAGSSPTGGLAGWVLGCPVSRTFTWVNQSGNQIGGLIGEASQARIANSFARGEISGASRAGGLVSRLTGDSSWVENCYSTGYIGKYSSTEVHGGLIGEAVQDKVVNSFWDRHTSTQVFSAAGTGKSTDQMKDPATYTLRGTTGLDAPWDFAGNLHDDTATRDIWTISPAVNDGYPHLVGFSRFPVRVVSRPTPAPPGIAIHAGLGSGIRVRTAYAARIRLQLFTASGSMVSGQEAATGADGWARMAPARITPGIYFLTLKVENLETGRVANFTRKAAL